MSMRKWVMLRRIFPLLFLICFTLSCDESLPLRSGPQNTLEIVDVVIVQGTGGWGIEVSIAVIVENVYHETFDGVANIKGNIRIWWKRRPEIIANLSIEEYDYLQLDPGGRYVIESDWFLWTDDGQYVLDLLDYSNDDVRYGNIYARPEVFGLEVKVTIFEEIGLLVSEPYEFTLQGWKPVEGEDTDGPVQP